MRQSETGDPAQTVALMLPGYCGLHKVDLLMDQTHRHPGEPGGNHLEEIEETNKKNQTDKTSRPHFATKR